ncbi:hypothetical protein J3459_016434 [Metarhizium acridum]|uniref:uncharacterized protein n=1 Tax=Metarhizium acridum TaxID=92637 RepID=UPI001C6D0340|nr:hypothetical protein J3458_020639 [Metarhizium acridum]KAG8411283.1 hypothetical protein J3459_016434 [Metarhizium acridum]
MPAHSEESWNTVFQIIFPKDPLPSSPYLDNDVPEPYAAFGHHLESNFINKINGLKQLMTQEAFEKLTKIVPETIRATLRDWWAKSSSGSQSGNSSHGQHDQQFEQRSEDAYASASVSGSSRIHRPMGQSVGDLSHHITRSHMAQDEIPTQQQNSPYNARYTCTDRVYQHSQSAASAWEPTNPNASTYNFTNQLLSSDSLEQAEQECFSRPSTQSNTGQSLTISESGFHELPVGFYGSTAQYQQQHNWGQHQHQYQHQEQKQDEELQQLDSYTSNYCCMLR